MIYSIELCLIAFLATKHIAAKDLAFSSPLNDPPRETNGIQQGEAIKSHCPRERKVEEKDYNNNIIEVTSLHTQYKSQHGNNEQEIRTE